jgi:hypothetical protein
MSRVNVLFQSGLFSRTQDPTILPALLGSDYMIPTRVGRFSQQSNPNDSFMILHKTMSPVASPKVQRFLEDAARESANPGIQNTSHPVIQLRVPCREIKPRIVPARSERERYLIDCQASQSRPCTASAAARKRARDFPSLNREKSRLFSRPQSRAGSPIREPRFLGDTRGHPV